MKILLILITILAIPSLSSPNVNILTNEKEFKYLVPQSENPLDLYSEEDIIALALNIYFEARSECSDGKLAVALITLNRVYDSRWPNTIIGVVWQKAQFSWTGDGLSDNPKDAKAWEEAQILARVAIHIYHSKKIHIEVVKDSYWYIAKYINPPVWTKKLVESGRLGDHIFYKERT